MNRGAASRRSGSLASRRVGYAIAIAVNAAGLFLINVSPGWESVGFLTASTPKVLPLVDLSLATGLVANLVYLVRDPPRLKASGDAITTAIGIASLIRVWQVFPFDFSGYSANWAMVIRIMVVVAIAGSAIALIVNLVAAVRGGP